MSPDSELERLRAELKLANDRLDAVSELSSIYYYSVRYRTDGAHEVEWLSDTLAQAMGVRNGPVREDFWRSIIAPEDHERVAAWMGRVVAGRSEPVEHRVLGPGGTRFWIHHFARIRRIDAQTFRVQGVAQGIHKRKQAEEALADSEARFRALAEHAADMIVETDEAGRLVYRNPAVFQILGFEPTDRSTPVEDLVAAKYIHPKDGEALLEEVRTSTREERDSSGSFRIRDREGAWRWISFAGRSFTTSSGRTHRVSIGRDITRERRLEHELKRYAARLEEEVSRRTAVLERTNLELRELQQRMLHAERLGAAEDLAASVAHAINNPLAALLGTVEMEIESTKTPSPLVSRIRRLAHRISQVVSQTLALYREGTLEIAVHPPTRVLEDVYAEIETRAATRGVEIDTKIGEPLPEISIDRTLMVAAIVSLAENALEAMPDGGTLWLSVEGFGGIGIVEFVVADSGPGIPEDLRDKIFEPFFSTKSAGTGLGLAIAQGVVRGHGGRIDVGSRPGGGTRIAVKIPLRCEDRSATPPSA